MDANKMSDSELGEYVELLGRNSTGKSLEEVGREMREVFFHSYQDQIDRELLDKIKMFSRYMKDAWRTPEGESCFVHAMKVMGRFKRHEKMLEMYVNSTGDAPILAACKLIEQHLGINPLVCVPVTEGVKHE